MKTRKRRMPLAVAFAIASSVTPQRGPVLYPLAIQIGGPAGAFVVVVAGMVEKFRPGRPGLRHSCLPILRREVAKSESSVLESLNSLPMSQVSLYR